MTDTAAWGWDCECGAAPRKRWTDYGECIASGHDHQVEDHGAIRLRGSAGYRHELKWGVRDHAQPCSPTRKATG